MKRTALLMRVPGRLMKRSGRMMNLPDLGDEARRGRDETP
jgi:hypothetical protein